MGKSDLAAKVPSTESGTVAEPEAALAAVDRRKAARPRRQRNSEVRTREHVTPSELELILAGTKRSRYPTRDRTMILMAYRHGLRCAEVVDLRWEQVDWKAATLHVRRVKNGSPSTHPINGDELRLLRQLVRESGSTEFIFVSERGTPFSTRGYREIVAKAGKDLTIKIHSHMLRHGCGYYLGNKGTDTRTIQAYLGHRNIQNTVKYTELSPKRFKGLFD